MGDEAGDYARRTERIKNLLSSYYGTAEQGQASPLAAHSSASSEASAVGVGAVARKQLNTTTLDSLAFDAETHIAQMTKGYTLERLLAEHRGMAREIKNLDSDMQQLVYENYNKFIAATDTIRAMKTNVDSMESDMDQLKTNMDAVADKSSAVNQKLLKRRQHIEELNRVQNLLNKLQAVFDLPARMKAALEEDALHSAVAYYAEALPLLSKYGHRGAFRGIAAESEAAAKELTAALKRRLAERKDDTEQVVLLLRQLGEGDDTLQAKYLQGRAQRMQKILQEGSLVADQMSTAAQSLEQTAANITPAGVESPESWGYAANGAVPSLSRFVKALDERLINTLQETVMNVNGIFLQDDSNAVRRKPLITVCKEIIGEYFQLVRRAVGDAAMASVAHAAGLHIAGGDKDFSPTAASLTFPEDWGAAVVLQATSMFTTDIGLLNNQLPELSLRDWAAACTEQVVRGHIAAAFGALQERIKLGVKLLCTQLNAPGADQVQPLSAAYNYLTETIQRGALALLKGLRVYEQQSKLLASWQDQLSDTVQSQLQALFQALINSYMAMARIKIASSKPGVDSGRQQVPSSSKGGQVGTDGTSVPDEPAKTGVVLLLAKLCVFMEGTTVPSVMELLAASFLGRGFRSSDEPPPFVGGEVARRLGTAANVLLSSYVDLHGRGLSMLVERSVCSTNWLQAQPPRAPRPVCDLLLERLAKTEAELARLMDSTGRTPGASALRPETAGSHHQRGGSAGDVLESAAVERGVAKLFRGKVQPFGAHGLKFTQSAVLSAVIVVGLKSLMEYIRLQTLGKAGLQQLQMDTYYMRPKLLRLTSGADAEAIAQLLDEIVAAGAERSNDPSMLEVATLEKALLALSR